MVSHVVYEVIISAQRVEQAVVLRTTAVEGDEVASGALALDQEDAIVTFLDGTVERGECALAALRARQPINTEGFGVRVKGR